MGLWLHGDAVMKYWTVLVLAAGMVSCQMQGGGGAPQPLAESSQLTLPAALAQYKSWPEVTKGPRQLLDPRHVRRWTLCTIPPPLVNPNPHATDIMRMKFTQVYADPAAWEVMRGPEPWQFKPGTAVVKTKGLQHHKTKERTEVGIGAMVKMKPGYDPAGGDWLYVYASLKDGKIEAIQRGKIESCIACHGPRKTRDHLYMPYLKSD